MWLKKHLFNSWYNTLLTIACSWLIYQVGSKFLVWVMTQAQWQVIAVNLPLFFVGRYPAEQYWRIWLNLALLGILTTLSLSNKIFGQQNDQKWLLYAWISLFPVILWLIGGGLGLQSVGVNLWNGLLLTLLMAIAGIFLSFPIGVLLALGRQSQLPIISGLSIAYIEIIRGLPLIGILFMAQVMLPLFLPPDLKIDRVVRAIAGIVMFSAAYLAENVRGGLQAVSTGQTEAAKALGLTPPLVMWLIVLPQALRAVVPAIAGQFIGLLKDTSLVSIVGLVDLVGISRSILAQPEFVGRHAEVYLFIGLIYWIFCYGIAIASRRFESIK
jgi:general L-amino acid transport system permease protein